MIDAMEALLEHWGEQRRRKGLGGSGASPLAGLIEWQGAPPRGEAASVVLLGGAGLDHVAAEVEAVLAALESRGQEAEQGGQARAPETMLVVLAEDRYWLKRALDEQLEAQRCAKSVYYQRVDQLHMVLEQGLKDRHLQALEDVKRVARKARVAKEATLARLELAEVRRADSAAVRRR